MREITFLKRNREKWEKYEEILANARHTDADTLAQLFVELTDDLSYARTYYPKSKTTQYLNQLAADVHRNIYRTRKQNLSTIKKFWVYDLPMALTRRRRELFASLAIYLFAMAVGMYSSAVDDSFVRMIMGDGYVNLTIENIEKGDPLAIYKDEELTAMATGIGFNNTFYAFITFVHGLYWDPYCAEMIFSTGVMVGSFHQMFINRDLGFEMFRVVYIHGALELSAIVIAGGAGISLLFGFLFPGTHGRLRSFGQAVLDGLRIMLGLVPVFGMAALLEGFVTRHTEMPLFLSLIIIGGSFAFIIWYFILYPMTVARSQLKLSGDIPNGLS